MAGKDFRVTLNRVSFDYPRRGAKTGDRLFEQFSMTVSSGCVVVVMGASGAGKSTLGRLLAGILQPVAGSVDVQGRRRKADVVYLDQSPINSVFPWQTAYKNIDYPLSRLGYSRGERRQRIETLARRFSFQHIIRSYPAALSGGELARMAIARCLSWRPRLAVLDEALVALDVTTRGDVIGGLAETAAVEGTGLVIITHNIADALCIGQRCVVVGGRPVKVVVDVHGVGSSGSTGRQMENLVMRAIRDGHL